MYCKLVLAVLAVIIGNDFATAQQIPSTTTAAELWNPWTWFWPYAIASAEGYRDYYQKAQKATNELYQQIYKTNAFPWITGNWGAPQPQPKPNESGQNDKNGGQSNQGGQNSENGAGGQPNQGGQNSENGAGGQSNQQDSNPDKEATQKPAQEGNAAQQGDKNEENQTAAEGTGAQVQGNVQDDGTAEAEVKPN